jgi:hypothetical protein
LDFEVRPIQPTGGPLRGPATVATHRSRFGNGKVRSGPAYIMYIYMYGQLGQLGVRAGGVSGGVSKRAGLGLLYVHIYVQIGVPKKIRAGRISRTGPFIYSYICTFICTY